MGEPVPLQYDYVGAGPTCGRCGTPLKSEKAKCQTCRTKRGATKNKKRRNKYR